MTFEINCTAPLHTLGVGMTFNTTSSLSPQIIPRAPCWPHVGWLSCDTVVALALSWPLPCHHVGEGVRGAGAERWGGGRTCSGGVVCHASLCPFSRSSTQRGLLPQTASQRALRYTDAEAAPPFVNCCVWELRMLGWVKNTGRSYIGLLTAQTSLLPTGIPRMTRLTPTHSVFAKQRWSPLFLQGVRRIHS